MKITDYTIGQTASISKIFSKEDINLFALLSLDCNPVHLDEEYAKTTIFKQNIVHGFLVGSLISAIIGTKLPGAGAIYLHQDMDFRKPAYIGDVITAQVTIKNIRTDKSILFLDTICLNSKKELLIIGSAVIKLM